jgi:hypothetical protein
MILLNFSQKLYDIQFDQFKALTSHKITEQIMLPIETSTEEDIHTKLDYLFNKVKLTDEELKADGYAILPPPQSVTALKVIADLYHRVESYPYVIRIATSVLGMNLRPAIVEVLDLQQMLADLPES